MDKLDEIKERLAGVDPSKPWTYNPKHEMFVGTTSRDPPKHLQHILFTGVAQNVLR